MSELWFLFILEPWTILCFQLEERLVQKQCFQSLFRVVVLKERQTFGMKTAVQFLDKMEFFII